MSQILRRTIFKRQRLQFGNPFIQLAFSAVCSDTDHEEQECQGQAKGTRVSRSGQRTEKTIAETSNGGMEMR